MKVWILYLAFLILAIVFIPHFASEYIITDNTLDGDSDIRLYDVSSGKTLTISLEDYIVGVVCAEMPAEFFDEALKAQAVAARTYAVKKIKSSASEHGDAELCTDFSHCQAYVSPEDIHKNWGDNYAKYMNKVKSAVFSTQGEYLVYNNEPAMAVFHACSNGITEKSSDVWGGDVPYLTNVESKGDSEKKDYVSYSRYSRDEFVKILEVELNSKIDITLTPIGNIEYSSGNNVVSIELFGNVLKGTDVRRMFSLKATSFNLEYDDSEFVFEVTGNGHGVGMSQYGANAMCAEGFTYREILNHYYPGTEIRKMNK